MERGCKAPPSKTFDFSEPQLLVLKLNCHLHLIVMDFSLAGAHGVLISHYRQTKCLTESESWI